MGGRDCEREDVGNMSWRGSVSDAVGTLLIEPLSIVCDVKYCLDLERVNQQSRVVN